MIKKITESKQKLEDINLPNVFSKHDHTKTREDDFNFVATKRNKKHFIKHMAKEYIEQPYKPRVNVGNKNTINLKRNGDLYQHFQQKVFYLNESK